MDVLVVGYGKIGRIKSFLWKSLGRKVSVYDIDTPKQEQAEMDGFQLYHKDLPTNDLIVDISTPASFHLHSLKWVLENLHPLPRSILIEKPLVSNEAELQALQELIEETKEADLLGIISVNESYYLSSALQFVIDDISRQGLHIQEVDTELSKNRLEDVAKGRFVDPYLGALGIELSHMIAMVQRLGHDIPDLAIKDVVIYNNGKLAHNEGFAIQIRSRGTQIGIRSFLGDFNIDPNGKIGGNHSIIRSLKIVTETVDYHISFDPVPGLERYKTKIRINNKQTDAKAVIVDDNHLEAHLRKIHHRESDAELDSLLGIENSLALTKFIFDLKKAARYEALDLTL